MTRTSACNAGASAARLANQSRISLVLWLEALSMTTWMSRSTGTLPSTSSRNLRNSLDAVPRHAFADDLASLHVECGEQRRRAMALVIVDAPLDLARAHRQHRLGAVERLDLALLVDARRRRTLGRIEIEADNVAHLLDEHQIGRQLEGLDAMRLQTASAQDAGARTSSGRPLPSPSCGGSSRSPQRVVSRFFVATSAILSSRLAVRAGKQFVVEPSRRFSATAHAKSRR